MFFLSLLMIFKIFFVSKYKSFPSLFLSLIMAVKTFSLIPIWDLVVSPSSWIIIDSFSFPIMVMTVMLLIMFEVANLAFYLMTVLVTFSLLTFVVANSLTFFVMFELNLVPIFFIIMGWGYQPERIYATKTMFFYTMMGSLPLLLFIIMNGGLSQLMLVMNLTLGGMQTNFFLMMLLAFLVKLPIFSLHLWLPLAHVEAPLVGSMILAGILLKLGGYGLVRMITMMATTNNMGISLLTLFCVTGTLISAFYCMVQVDMKVIIAYSSVVHMSLAAASALTLTQLGMNATLINLVAHGFISSMMFFSAGLMYSMSGSRSILMNKGLIAVSPMLITFWFLTCLSNAGGPPTINLLSEIWASFAIILVSKAFIPLVVMILFISMLFNMKLFSIPTQGYTLKNNLTLPITYSSTISALLHLSSSIFMLMFIFIITNYSEIMILLA